MRTIVYIDTFNLYYGACMAPGRRWLNPVALAQRLLPNDEIIEIAYFTANIKRDPEDPGAQDRQRLYHRALRTIPNLEIFLGRYISKQVRGEELGLHVTVVNPVLHSKHRSAALSPDPLPAKASFIRLSARNAECQFPDQIVSPKGARLVKPETW